MRKRGVELERPYGGAEEDTTTGYFDRPRGGDDETTDYPHRDEETTGMSSSDETGTTDDSDWMYDTPGKAVCREIVTWWVLAPNGAVLWVVLSLWLLTWFIAGIFDVYVLITLCERFIDWAIVLWPWLYLGFTANLAFSATGFDLGQDLKCLNCLALGSVSVVVSVLAVFIFYLAAVGLPQARYYFSGLGMFGIFVCLGYSLVPAWAFCLRPPPGNGKWARITNSACWGFLVVVLLAFTLLRARFVRGNLLDDHLHPDDASVAEFDAILIGTWDITEDGQFTDYSAFEVFELSDADTEDISNGANPHNEDTLKQYLMVGDPELTVGPHPDRDHELPDDLALGYVLNLKENGYIDFQSVVYDTGTLELSDPSSNERMLLLRIEDRRHAFLDWVHGIAHGSFGLGSLQPKSDGSHEFQRINRWAWAPEKAWVATSS